MLCVTANDENFKLDFTGWIERKIIRQTKMHANSTKTVTMKSENFSGFHFKEDSLLFTGFVMLT